MLDKPSLDKWRQKKGNERNRSEYLLAFRSKLGEKAHHNKNGSRASDWVAATVAWAWKSSQSKLSGVAYRHLSKVQQHLYDEEKKVRERKKG